MLRKTLLSSAAVALALSLNGPAWADMAAAEKWIDEEFQPSTLSKEEQMEEMQWFVDAAQPFQGMEIKVVSETIPTHSYESETLTRAFQEITGITVTHDLIQEGDVIEKLQTQMQSDENIYDAYINDSRSDRHPQPLPEGKEPHRLDGRRRRRRHAAHPRHRRLHRQGLHHRPRRQALPAPGPAVRQPLLVPLRLVHRPRHQGRLRGNLRLPPRRARQLVRL